MRVVKGAAIAAAVTLLLTGCFGPGDDELIARASVGFNALVDQASAVDIAVLHTLEVEKPALEACEPDPESNTQQTVFVAAGTMAVQTDAADARELVDGFELSQTLDDDTERWTEIRKDLEGTQRAWGDPDGITASVTVDDGLLVVAVFTPCR